MRYTHTVFLVWFAWLVLTGIFAQAEISAAADTRLETTRTCSLVKSWDDKGSGADLDGFFYLPVVDASSFIIGGYGTRDKKLTTDDCMLTVRASAQLVEPIAWKLIWLDRGSGARKDGSMWRAIPPSDDYRCIGTIPQIDYEEPNLSNYRCVPATFTKKVITSTVIWTDKGSGAKKPVSMFKLPNSGSFVAIPRRLAQVEAYDLKLTSPDNITEHTSQTMPQVAATPVTESQPAPATKPPPDSSSLTNEMAKASDSPTVSDKALALLKEMDTDTLNEVLSTIGVTADRDDSKSEPAAVLDTETPESETESEQVANQLETDTDETVSDRSSAAQDSVSSDGGKLAAGQHEQYVQQELQERPADADASQPTEIQDVAPYPSQVPGLPTGVTGDEMCTTEKQGGSACWMELENQPGCYFWPPSMLNTAAATWTGACADGLAEGNGTMTGFYDVDDDFRISYTATGHIQRGKPNGQWVVEVNVNMDNSSSNQLWKGPFVDGKTHGVWIERGADDGTVSEVSYVDDLLHGKWVTRYPDGDVHETTYVNGEAID